MSNLAINGGTPARTRPFPAYPYYGPEVEAALTRVYRSQAFCSQVGSETAAFEREFAAWHGLPHGVAFANGTFGLQLAIAAMGIGPGDEVLVPSYTFIASASAVVAQNAIPVLVDSETASQGLDPEAMERLITPRTKAVMPVHINGYPCDMDRVMAIARKHGLKVIEDCSHAHGARHRGRLVGTIGDVGVFSLQHKKNLSVGEGGIAITADAALAERMRGFRHFGNLPMKNNMRMSEFHAAVGRVQLGLLAEMHAIRQRNAAHLIRRLAGLPGLTALAGLPDTESAYYNAIFLYDPAVVGVPRTRFVQALKAEGIPVHIFYYPLQRDSILQKKDAFGRGCPFSCPLYGRKVEYRVEDAPVAARLCDEVNIEIKVQPPCGEADMDDIATAIRKLLANADELRAAPAGKP